MQPTAQQVLDAVNTHNYALAVVLALIASVMFIRKVSPMIHGGLGTFLNSKRGGSLLVVVGGAAGAVGTALMAGQHLTLSLALGALMTAAAASGGWNLVRDILGLSDKPKTKKLADTVKSKVAMWIPLLVTTSLMLAGCGASFTTTALKTEASIATLTSSGYRMSNAADKAKQDAIRTKAMTDARAAEAELNAYLSKYGVVLKALDTTSVALETGHALIPVVERALSAEERVKIAAWVATLLKAGTDVVSALDGIGVKVPGFEGGVR